jgi:hypothetical protein
MEETGLDPLDTSASPAFAGEDLHEKSPQTDTASEADAEPVARAIVDAPAIGPRTSVMGARPRHGEVPSSGVVPAR